jgi:hypothetical protein
MRKYRQGRKIGHTIYLMVGDEPSDGDLFIGSCVDVQEAAKLIIRANRPDPPQELLRLLDKLQELVTWLESIKRSRRRKTT